MSTTRARRTVRGLYAVTRDCDDTARVLREVSAAIDGGVRLVQYRNKSAVHALKLAQAQALKALCAARGATLIVNDSVDIALAVDADGVHVGREDSACAKARAALGPDKLIGVSCYDSIERAHEAQRSGADHVAFGSFFPSRVKPGAVQAPIDLLAAARREIDLPIVAIGGITAENGSALVRAGAHALAVITALFDATDITAAAARFAPLFAPSA